MTDWSARPRDVAALLNPAFCGRLLQAAALDYGSAGMPLSHLLLVLPIVLHKRTREKLPENAVASPALTWISEHPEVRVGLAERIRHLLPTTRESLLLLLANGTVRCTAEGGFVTTTSRGRSSARDTSEIRDCIRRARFLGRWFARAGSPPTLYALLGIRL